MLQNSRQLLLQMREQEKCLVAFNVYNLETIQAVFAAAKAKKVPAIIAFGESYLEHTTLEAIASIVYGLDRVHGFPIVLHLDHCKSLDTIEAAIEAGFTSIMYDGSNLPFEQNIANTASVVDYAHKRDVTVEAELGYMNPEHGADYAIIGPDSFTDPHQAEIFVSKTGVDSLAVAVGNAHGLYKAKPSLELNRIKEISSKTGIPLVLHGSSGIPREQIQAALSAGIAKINVNTEVALAGGRTIRLMVEQSSEVLRLEKIMKNVQASMISVMEEFLELSK